jgi:DNA-binding CsgD family transcriptional regulator
MAAVATASAQTPGLPLFEREAELAALAARAEAARAGDGNLVVVEGTAGIGKTRLLAEARHRTAQTMRVLHARGGELEGEFAFGVVRQLFEPLLATAAPEARAELLAGAATLAAPLFETASLAAPVEPEGDASFPMLHGLYWLAANVAFEQPTMLAIDDLHWADSPSLRWLAYLARRLEGLPLLVAVGTRPPEQARDPALVTELLSDPAATSVQPGPLTAESIAALVRERFEEDADPAFSEAVEAATRGNPLFVLALLDTVAREGIRPQSDQAHVLLELGPLVVGRAVSLRLARLPDEATALLEAAAILGDGTALRHVAALAGLEPAPAARAAHLLLRSDLLIREDPVEFFHPVVRSAIYEGLDSLARSEGHGRAARLLVEAGAPPEQAAAHLLATAAGTDPFVAETLRAAAHRSLAQGAADAAAGYLARALEESLGVPERAEVLVELGLAKRLIDGPAAVEHLTEGLALLDDPERRAEVSLELGGVLFYLARLPEAIAVYQQALAETSRADFPDLSERLEAELIASAWWTPETFPLAQEHLGALDLEALHGGFGSDSLLAVVAFYQGRLARDRDFAMTTARRALASGELVANGGLVLHYAAFALVSSGLFEDAFATYDAALEAAQRRGDVFRAAPLLVFRGRAKQLCGDLEGALADMRAGLDLIVEQRVDTALPYGIAFLAMTLLDRGDVEEAAAVIARMGLPEEVPINANLFFVQLSRGRLRIESGNAARGVEELLELGRRVQIVTFDNPANYAWRRFAAEGLHLLGRDGEALALAEANLEIARRWGAKYGLGAALRTVGVLRGGSEGEDELRAAIAILAGSGARLEHARALIELGAALRRANRRSDARDLLREGVELAHRSGSIALVERGNEELAATGARPRKVLAGGLDALTASERRVAEIAARDRSNKEIAQELFVTVKTVELHLSSVYRKLQINSRRQLATALAGGQAVP